jgi:hypothetical protein
MIGTGKQYRSTIRDGREVWINGERIDCDNAKPIRILRTLWKDYKPKMEAYPQRAIDPTQAPGYGVPGGP